MIANLCLWLARISFTIDSWSPVQSYPLDRTMLQLCVYDLDQLHLDRYVLQHRLIT